MQLKNSIDSSMASWLPEYDAATQHVGMIDRTNRAVLQLRGRDRQTFLQGMVTNDVLALQPGQNCRVAMLDVTGHIQADMRIHARPTMLLIETDTRIAARLAQTLDKYLIMEKVAIDDVSADWAIITVIGPGAAAMDLEGGALGFAVAQHDTNLPGWDLWLPSSRKPEVWEGLLALGVTPLGEQAAEALRIEAGTALWGSELDESVLLPEAELPNTISYTKGCYIGQEIIARLRARGHTNKTLRHILLETGAPVPNPGDTIHANEDAEQPGREIGRITSATLSPANGGRALALAYARKEYLEDGTAVAVHSKDEFGNETVSQAAVKTTI